MPAAIAVVRGRGGQYSVPVVLGLLLAAAVSPRVVSARATARACGAVAAYGLAGLGLAATTHAGATCADNRVDARSWQAARADERSAEKTHDERMAEAIVDCRLVDGRSREEIRRLLGKPDERGGPHWYWAAGWVHGGLGPGDGQFLVVTFGRDGRVARTALAY